MFIAVVEFFEAVFKNLRTIWRLSLHQAFTHNKDTKLGFLWNFLSPLLLALVYWLVFGIGFKNGSAFFIGEDVSYSYLSWMFSGIFPFFYFRANINDGINAVYSKYVLVSRAGFPVVILPVVAMITNFLIYLPTFLMPIIQLIISGDFSFGPNIFLFFYFSVASVFHFIAVSLVLSALGMLSRDFSRIMRPVIRMLMYFSPVVWSFGGLSDQFAAVLKYNPLYYLFELFRGSFLNDYPINLSMSLYFWIFTLVVFIIGCFLHYKNKDKYYTLATR